MTQIKDDSLKAQSSHDIWPGRPFPFGSHWNGEGVNFAIYSQHARAVELLLFDETGAQVGDAFFLPDKTGPVWHGYVPGLKPGQLYGYRVHGDFDPEGGHRFNPNKVLLDPYTRAIGRPLNWHDALFSYPLETANDKLANLADSGAYAPLSCVVNDAFDWEGDARLNTPWTDTVTYETHVKGISMCHPEVPGQLRGTYLGLASEPILAHLKDLGVTAVQLLPVQAKVDDLHLVSRGLRNYWGYNTLAYFAPEPSYAAGGPQAAVHEFKTMVKALHRAGLELIVDVVYNHTGEGHQLGPTLSFKGIDNRAYYKLNPENPRYYMDYTGTGNTLDPGNPYVLQLITDSLRYWVEEMHVDGFRFDLASALAREFYDVDMLSAFFKVIQQDPVLSRVKLIAEPWDVGYGGYQVGNFPWQWCELNGKYRDTLRAYWRGGLGHTGELATRVAGSSDLYAHDGRKPYASVNFITSHDGFTLHDLVSYTRKHNHANGESNRDGDNHNLSQNFGVEGPTDEPQIIRKRETVKRSLLASLFLSQGIPMLLGGDELSRTQWGNNNGYAQDNALSWYDWQLDDTEQDFLAFVKHLIAFRKAHPIFRRRTFLTGRGAMNICKDVSWWRPSGEEMTLQAWNDPDQQALGMMLCGSAYYEPDVHGEIQGDDTFLVVFHGTKRVMFTLPPCPDAERWRRVLTTLPGKQKSARYEAGKRLRLEPYGLSLFQGIERR